MPTKALKLNVGLAVEMVRETYPVVHCIAPREATSFVADVLYATSAVPVVTGTTPDALASVLRADSLALDLGTLSAEGHEGLGDILNLAGQQSMPWVLDVTRLGRAPIRDDLLDSLLAHRPAVVRAMESDEAELNRRRIEGALTLTSDDEIVRWQGREVRVVHHCERLRWVAGVRSTVAALTAACATVTEPWIAAVAGPAWLAAAATMAGAGNPAGPASFRVALVDALASVHGDQIAETLQLG